VSGSNVEHPAITYHLAPREVWERQAAGSRYLPETYESEGFIHCTDGEAEVIAVANRYYMGDKRAYVVLSIARDRVTAPVKYEDPARTYPHVYGPLNVDAVDEVRPVRRAADGAFLGIAE
jgi:uncharacterized protein (DUF952 family)